MNGVLKIHYVHWNGICEIITSPAKAQLRVNIPSNALLIMTVHTLIKAYRLLLTTYHLPPTTYYCLPLITYRLPLTAYHLPFTTYHLTLATAHCSLLTAHCSLFTAHCLLLAACCLLLTANSTPRQCLLPLPPRRCSRMVQAHRRALTFGTRCLG